MLRGLRVNQTPVQCMSERGNLCKFTLSLGTARSLNVRPSFPMYIAGQGPKNIDNSR